MNKEDLKLKIKNLGDFGFTGKGLEYRSLLITKWTQKDEVEYCVYGENDESENGIFSSNNLDEVIKFVVNY